VASAAIDDFHPRALESAAPEVTEQQRSAARDRIIGRDRRNRRRRRAISRINLDWRSLA